MHFRSISDLNNCIVAGLAKVPRDVDLVVGLPRSGMLPATILALYLNTPLADLDGLLAGRLMQPGIAREKFQRVLKFSEVKKVLVIDDSCSSGSQLQMARDRIKAAGIRTNIVYAAAYVAPQARHLVDFYFDVCPIPRMFEWNIMHHPALAQSCLDVDGVLCCDPTDEENDDQDNYRRFLDEAKPLWIPTVPVGWLVTSRLEKYRTQTETWMARHAVRYGKLIMLNMKSAAERRIANCHGRFKGEVYRSTPAELFIESNPAQASEIAELGCKPVFCTTDRQVYLPSTRSLVGDLVQRVPAQFPNIGWRILVALRRRLLR